MTGGSLKAILKTIAGLGDEELRRDCHFDERSEEKSYNHASFKLKVSSLKLSKSILTSVKTTGFLASLEMTEVGALGITSKTIATHGGAGVEKALSFRRTK